MLSPVGHGGANTADHTVKTLPGRIRESLAKVISEDLHGQLNRENIVQADPIVAAMIARVGGARAILSFCN